MSDLSLLLIVLFSILTVSLALLRRWFRNRSVKFFGSGQQDNAADLEAGQGEESNPLDLPPAPGSTGSVSLSRSLQVAIFAIAFAAYLATRIVGLERFPITFFADEAASTVIAAEWVENGLRYEDELLPTYFQNVDKYSLSVTVYMQALPYLVFGKSVLATRATSVLVGSAGILAISLALKQIFKTAYWWTGVVWLLLTPAWFMHSRTAFETPIAASFYALFILCYLLYLYRSPRLFPLAIVAAALTFYSYNPARVIVAATVALFALADRRYHFANRKIIRRSWWLMLLCLLPYGRFLLQHPFAGSDQLLLLNSYWVQDLALGEKLLRFAREYGRGLSPFYWYFPHDQDLARHTMKGYGHILWVTLPFAAWGIFTAWKHRRSAAYRVLLLTLISAPLGGALVETTVTRSLAVVIPLTLLTAVGFSDLILRFVRSHRVYVVASAALLGSSVALSTAMTADALRNGPTWYQDYTLYGMQYGSPELFSEINARAQASPEMEFVVSPYWANGTVMLARFFMDDLDRLSWGVIDDYLAGGYPLGDDTIFVMLPEEYERASSSRKVERLEIDKILYYPDGRAGFYFGKVVLKEPGAAD